ncbi:MAG TPA: tetratricopeptide repeat protein, partial [Thermoanaerobaculia bacterium]|nr:tetratricopeptide repeat protein [Thermoanaerobaculia bacterium]
QLLLKKSIDAAFEDPGLAVRLANLAVRASAHLGEAYDPYWVMDLRARALAYLGNARRVLGELQSAEEAFRKAEAWLEASTTGNVQVQAEILGFKSSLRRDQRRFGEALELVERALHLYQEAGDSGGIAKCLLKKSKILEETGRFAEAIELLRGARIPRDREPLLFAYARYNLLVCLVLSGQPEEAERLLPEVRSLLAESGKPLNLIRLRWAEGLIDLGMGRSGPAEAAFRGVQEEFLERGMGYDAALVSLDLAFLYAREGETKVLQHLALELMPVFTSREIHREATAALLMFQHVCEEERASAGLVRQLGVFLRRERRGRGV